MKHFVRPVLPSKVAYNINEHPVARGSGDRIKSYQGRNLVDIEFIHDPAAVCNHRFKTDAQLHGDLFGGKSFRGQFQDFAEMLDQATVWMGAVDISR